MGWRIRGTIQDWTLCGRYSGRCTGDYEANFDPLVYSSVSFPRPAVTFPGFTIFSGLIQLHYIYRHYICTLAYSVE